DARQAGDRAARHPFMTGLRALQFRAILADLDMTKVWKLDRLCGNGPAAEEVVHRAPEGAVRRSENSRRLAGQYGEWRRSRPGWCEHATGNTSHDRANTHHHRPEPGEAAAPEESHAAYFFV